MPLHRLWALLHIHLHNEGIACRYVADTDDLTAIIRLTEEF